VTTLAANPDRRRDAEMRLTEAARFVPSSRGDRPTHPATLTRWILRGVRLRDGRSLKLAARRYPGGWSVTRQALDDFVSALTADRCGGPAPAAIEPPVARRDAHDRAEATLDAAGI
jgi:hypothetical protein